MKDGAQNKTGPLPPEVLISGNRETEMVTHSIEFLPGKFHGQRSLVGYSLWGDKESDMTDRLKYKGNRNSKPVRSSLVSRKEMKQDHRPEGSGQVTRRIWGRTL